MKTALIVFAIGSLFGTTSSAQGRREEATSSAAGALDRRDQLQGAPARTSGTVTGRVTAKGASGDTLDAANVLVQLWSLDEPTGRARNAACSAWQVDKGAWLQARQEIEYPSGMDLIGTPVGKDVALIKSLFALRRDTVRSDAKGNFNFSKVPFGAYTVEGEAIANDRFVQWSKDVAVIPVMPTVVALDASTLLENQYCNTVAQAADTAVVQANDLDAPLRQLFSGADVSRLPSFRAAQGETEMTFVVGPEGVPELPTLRITKGAVSGLDAQTYVGSLHFAPPTVHGKPVRTLAQLRIGVTVRRVQ